MDVDVFAIHAELEVGRLGIVKLFLQGLSDGQVVVVIWRKTALRDMAFSEQLL